MDTKSELLKICNSMVNDINLLNAESHYENAKQCIKEGIDNFYKTYPPRFYKRTEKLASFMHPELYNDDFSLGHGPQYLEGEYNSHEKNPASAEYIYLIVFILGYHGGAYGGFNTEKHGGAVHPAPGIPYWRKPVKYGYPFWGRMASRAESSPIQNIAELWNNYVKNKWPLIKKNNWGIVLNKYRQQLTELAEIAIQLSFSTD